MIPKGVNITMSKHNTNCCVYGCNSRMGANPPKTIHFHRFPKPGSNKITVLDKNGTSQAIDRRLAWEKALLRIKPATTHMRVCSKHFRPSDYINSDLTSTASRLKLNSVPSLNLPKRPPPKAKEKFNSHNCDSFNTHPVEYYEKRGQTKTSEHENKTNCENYYNKLEGLGVLGIPVQLMSSLSEKEKMAISGLLTLTLTSGRLNGKSKR